MIPLFLLAASLLAADRVTDASSGKAPRAGDMVLFPLDDVTIPWRENLKVTMMRPVKQPGNPVMRGGPVEGVDGFGTLLYGTVVKQGGKFRMWYLATARADSRIPGDADRLKLYRPVAYAESTDGVNWVRPNLGLVEFRGNRNNNLVAIEPASDPYSRAYDFIAVHFDADDPDPSRQYKMAYITQDIPRASGSTATAVSPDGLRWKLVNTTMFTRGHFENTSLTRFDGLYYLAGQNIPPHDGSLADGSPAGRVMKVFFSPDFKHWSSGRALAFHRDGYETKPTTFGQETHMGAGIWNRGNVIVGLYGRWYGDTIITEPKTPHSPLKGLKMDLGVVVSNDAIHYREPVRNFIAIPHGGPDDWDSESILQGNAFANTETETFIWYSHWYTSRPNVTPPLPETLSGVMIRKGEGVGLARMPRDRFACFSKLLPVSQERRAQFSRPIEASMLSKPIRLTAASRLYANVSDVSSAAPLRIALVDDAERPLPGFESTITAESLKSLISWKSGPALPVNRAFRIRTVWPEGTDRAKLWALYVEAGL